MQSLAVQFLHQSIQSVFCLQLRNQVELILLSLQLGGEQLDFRFAACPPASDSKILGIPMCALQNPEAGLVTQIPVVFPRERVHSPLCDFRYTPDVVQDAACDLP